MHITDLIKLADKHLDTKELIDFQILMLTISKRSKDLNIAAAVKNYSRNISDEEVIGYKSKKLRIVKY